MRFYRPNVDRLEARRMMASDLALDYQTIADSSGAGALTTKVIPVLEPASTTLTFESVLGNPILDFALDSIIVHSQSRTVVASRFHSQLLIFNQSETGSPSITARVQLDIGIQDVKVDGSRAMVVGQSASDHTEVIAVDLMQGKILNRVQLAPGSFTFSHLRGDDAWLVLNSWYRSAQADESEPVVTERADLIHLQWSDEGLTRKSVLPVPAHGQWSVGDNRLLVAADTRHSDGTATTTLQMYDLGLSPIVEIASLELANSFTKSLVISQDGLSASLYADWPTTPVTPHSSTCWTCPTAR